MTSFRTVHIDDLIKSCHKKEFIGAEITALTIMGLNPLVFGLPGGAILPLTEMIGRYGLEIDYILAKNESLAVFAAAGYGAVTGLPAFVAVTSGPGALNSLPGAYDATMEFYPVVIITANVPKKLLKNPNLRIFQEAQIAKGGKFFAKKTFFVDDVKNIQKTLIKAYKEAMKIPQGAVLVDIPKDIFFNKIKFEYFEPLEFERKFKKFNKNEIKDCLELIDDSKRPLVVIGRGALSARKELWNFIEQMELPFCYTLKGKGILPDDHPQNYGYIGMHGLFSANKALYDSDLVIIIGSNGDDRAFPNPQNFTKGKKIIINPYVKNFNARIKANVICDTGAEIVLPVLNKQLFFKKLGGKLQSWHNNLRKMKLADKIYNKLNKYISPIDASKIINEQFNPDLLVLDVGEHQQHATKFIQFKTGFYSNDQLLAVTPEYIVDSYDKSILTSGTSGTMGTAISYTFGAKIAKPKIQTLTILGDGCLEMHLSSLWFTALEFSSIQCVLFNNREFGEIEELITDFHKYKETYLKNSMKKDGPEGQKIIPQFKGAAQIYNLYYETVSSEKTLNQTLKKFKKLNRSYLVEILVNRLGAYPIIPSGKTVKDTINKPLVG